MPDSAVTVVRRPPLVDDAIEAVRDAATTLDADVYLVGGFVRDRLLGSPGKDLDLVSVGSDGEPVLRKVASGFGWPQPQRFDRFGTAQVRGDGFVIEIVRARSESYDSGVVHLAYRSTY